MTFSRFFCGCSFNLDKTSVDLVSTSTTGSTIPCGFFPKEWLDDALVARVCPTQKHLLGLFPPLETLSHYSVRFTYSLGMDSMSTWPFSESVYISEDEVRNQNTTQMA